MASSTPLKNQEYTVGWICALPIEMAAARAMLDELHGRPREQHKSDQNTYFLGRIGQHNIVIACLPAGVFGTTSAATVAAQMLSSFESIRIGLMVGIGGGVPSKACDVRLGDVVVSKPGKTFGGVVQYDFGKTIEGGQFTRTGSLNKPPQILLNAVAGLETEHIVEESKIPQFLSDMLAKHSKMQADFSYQGAPNDRLYQADYDHVGGNACESCDTSKVIDRPRRGTDAPQIHYGVIASGNQVIKHGVTRDRLREELDIICFEMEAAGLMDNFPCLVIRGICDYADSHKNKRWQQYAAATAAAYTKEILGIIPASQVEKTPLAAEAIKADLDKIIDDVSDVKKIVNSAQEGMFAFHIDNYRENILSWITPIEQGPEHSSILSRRTSGTGIWLLNSTEFHAWVNGTQNTMFCPGIPGAGKTIIAATVVHHLMKAFQKEAFPDHRTGIAFLYCSYKTREEQEATHLLCSLLKQLVRMQPLIPESVKALYDDHVKQKTHLSFEEVSELLLSVIQSCSRAFVVIDALDECEAITRIKLLSVIRNFQAYSAAKLMATSRFIAAITEEFQHDINLEVRASREDVERYLDSQMLIHPSFVSQSPNISQLIKTGISNAVDGMFLLARLHLDSLQDKVTENEVTSALERLPRGSEGLSKAYEDAVKRIDDQLPGFRNLAKRVLAWIVHAQRLLTTRELQHALAVKPDRQELDETKIPGVNIMVSVCAGLVTVDPKSNIIQLVHYTTHEYFERIRATWIPDAPTDIARTCLAYLSFKTFASGCSPNDEEFEARLAKNVFLRYAARNWANHAREVQVNVKEVALPFLKNESLASASNQAAIVPKFRSHGYSQGMEISGLHLVACFGLQEFLVGLLENNECVDDTRYGRTPLSLAAGNGHKEIVKLLLEKAVNVDSKDYYYGRTPLSWAAGNGHKEVVELLLRRAVDVDSRDNAEGRTPLSWAAENGHEAVVKLLLEKALDVNSKSRYGQTPLSRAANNGHEAVVRLLLENAVNVDSKSGYISQTPLSLAAGNGHKEVVKLLLERAVNVDSKDSQYSRTPLSWAAGNGHKEVVKLLLEKAVDVDSKDSDDGRTPLSWAAGNGHKEVVKLLLEEAVNVDSKGTYDGRTPLSWAAENGHEAVMNLLIEKAVDVDSKSSNGQTPLSWAAGSGHKAVVKLLLEKAVDVNSESRNGRTPLSLAAGNGHEAVVKLLLEKAVDVNSKDTRYGRTPLLWAAENGHEAVVKLLLEKAVNVDCKFNIGRKLILWAVENGHEAVVKLLLEKAVDVDSKVTRYGRTPLLWAAENGHESVVKLLLEEAVDVNSKSRCGRTPLSWAAGNGHDAVVKLLLEKAVDVDSKDSEYGRTPLSWAAGSGHEVVVSLLLEKAIDVDSKDTDYGRTPLSWAAGNGHEAVVKLLLEKAVDVDSKSSIGRTPLSWAAGSGHEAVVKLLLEKVVDVNSKTRYGRTPLSLAAGNGHKEVVKLLLEEAVDVDSKDTDYGRTPLSWAAENGHEAVMNLLIEKAADVNSKSSYGRTPLSWAAGCGHEAAVKLLLEKAVDVDSKSSYGRTPLSWAAGNGHEAVVKLLLEKAFDVDSKDTDYGRTPLSWAAKNGHKVVMKLLESKTQRSQQNLTFTARDSP